MAKPVISNKSRFWVIATTRCLLLWVVCQSVLAAVMPMGEMSDCCPAENPHAAHEHMPLDSVQAMTMEHDHADCEHCAFGCQFLASNSDNFFEISEKNSHSISLLFSLANPSMDLPFRPPILF